jgi:plastocyanin/uncharacterized membrane protein YozB (DUF420 family)
MNGFLGTGATMWADLNLVIQVAMGLMLLAGMALARAKRFRAHKYCQSSVMLLNLVMIALVMSPSFHSQVEPRIPEGLTESYYLVATLHAALGTAAELLGIYIVLVAATKILPARWRFKRFKPWMRAELALWWAVILLGLGTYYVWYVAPSTDAGARQRAEAAEQSPATAERATVTITNFQFEPRHLTVTEGTVVEWVDATGRHTVEADDGAFKSEMLSAGGRFEHRFDKAGTFPYYCGFHGDKGGEEMAGTVTVVPRSR